jgi:hypothetical protein
MLRNTEPLNANKGSHYDLEVKAEDCGGRVSDDASISIEVTPVCKRGLTGETISQISASFMSDRILCFRVERASSLIL